MRRSAWVLLAIVATACTRATAESTPPPSASSTPAPASTSSTTPTTSTTTTVPPSTQPTTTTSTSSTTSTSTTSSTTSSTTLPVRSSIWEVRPPSDIPAPPLPPDWRSESIGTSVEGREIVAVHRPVESPRRRVLVVGGIHGNEPVSPPIVRSFVEAALPDDVEVWLVAEMNPDGVAAGTRANANEVDLNRNFAWTWRPDDGGPAPESEPEVRAILALIEQIAPDLVVWVHQPLGYVSSIGETPDAYERAWAAASGVPVRPDVTQHGGGESWTALAAGIDAMLVEVDGWDDTPQIVAAHRAGFEALLAALP